MKTRTPIPGFVDLQVNGYKGVDFSSPQLTRDSLVDTCRQIFAAGTAAFLPTIITSPAIVYERNLPIISQTMRMPEFQGRILGVHLEGPFISAEPGAVGAHNPAYVRAPDLDLLQKLHQWSDGTIRLLTVAAELPGIEEIVKWAVGVKMTVSVGHSLASDADLARLSSSGAVAITHLGNGLPGMLPRHPNPIWAGLAADQFTAMIITDGHHLPDSVITTVVRTKGVGRTIVVSDASPLAGLPPGRYEVFGSPAVIEKTGKLHNPERQCLVGSSSTMTQCMNYLSSLKLLTRDDMLSLGFYNPLRLIDVNPRAVNAPTELWFDEESRAFSIAGTTV
jgi:N-acetylglucosamine-6-phosphate deacetylase